MTILQLKEFTPLFLTLMSALSAFTYLVFFILFDKGKNSVIKTHIVIFVANAYLLYLSVFLHLYGFSEMQKPYHIFRVTMVLSGLLLAEAIFRRHAPKILKLSALTYTLVFSIILLIKDNVYPINIYIDYASILFCLSFAAFTFVGLKNINKVVDHVKARIQIMSKSFLLITIIIFLHYVVFEAGKVISIVGVTGSIFIHSLVMSHRNKSTQFKFHPVFVASCFALTISLIIYPFIFKDYSLVKYTLICLNSLAILLLFEQIKSFINRRIKTISPNFLNQIKDYKDSVAKDLKEKVNSSFDDTIFLYDRDDFPMIDYKQIYSFFKKNNFIVSKNQINTVQKDNTELFTQLKEIFYTTRSHKLYAIESKTFMLIGFESDSMMATESQKMDAEVLKVIIESQLQEGTLT